MTFWGVTEKFSLFWYHLNVVFSSILHGKLEDAMKLVNIITEKSNIICLANTSHMDIPKVESKIRQLGDYELLVVSKFLKPIRIAATLLYAKLVLDWAHQGLVPLNICMTIFQPVVKV